MGEKSINFVSGIWRFLILLALLTSVSAAPLLPSRAQTPDPSGADVGMDERLFVPATDPVYTTGQGDFQAQITPEELNVTPRLVLPQEAGEPLEASPAVEAPQRGSLAPQTADTAADLDFYTPTGWAGPVVLSSVSGTNQQGNPIAGSPAYLDWAIWNSGDLNATSTFYVYLYIDSVYWGYWYVSGGLQQGYYTYVADYTLPVEPSSGWHLVQLWIDPTNVIPEANEDNNVWSGNFYWNTQAAAPNLVPYIPAGWAGPVVPTSGSGASASQYLFTNTNTYFDVAFANLGGQNAPTFATCLELDGVQLTCWNTSLQANYFYTSVDQYFARITTGGWHTVTLRVDANNQVAESNEADNTWSYSFYWETSNLPNLHPYQPQGWSHAIVPAMQAGTNQFSVLSGGSPTYFDWAIINDGWGNVTAPSFTSGLYLDGVLINSVTWTSGLNYGYYLYNQDISRTVTQGWHTLELKADIYNQVTETNESDNTLALQFYWDAASGAPRIRVEPTSLTIQMSSTTQNMLTPRALNPTPQETSPITEEIPFSPGLVPEMPSRFFSPAAPIVPAAPDELAASVDLSAYLPPVRNQGQGLSCVGWSTAYYYKTLQEKMDQGWDVSTANHQFSPNFIWNQAQTTAACSGVHIHTAMDLFVQQGALPFNYWSYTETCARRPTLQERDIAAQYRASQVGALNTYSNLVNDAVILQMKQYLAGNDALVIGLDVTNGFNGLMYTNPPNALLDLPDTLPSGYGRHAVLVVGYDDNIAGTGKGGFKMVNSWGTTWGDNGFIYLSYEWVRRYVREVYYMRDIRTGGVYTRDFTITNDGSTTLTINNLTKRSGSAWLTLVPPPALPIQIEPGQRATIEVAINVSAVTGSSLQEIVEVHSNDPNTPVASVTVNLQTGVAAGTPPGLPSAPAPANSATDVHPGRAVLQWTATDADAGDSLLYDVRLGTSSPPAQVVCNDVSTAVCVLDHLQPNTHYYWRVAVNDGPNITLGPVWEFTTGADGSIVFMPGIRR
jgi:C1A family cysteine protease